MHYEDFVIQITGRGSDEAVLRVSESPVGESAEVVAGTSSALGRLLSRSRLHGGLDEFIADGGAERLGQVLFEALFVEPVHRRFLEAVGRSSAGGARGLRLKLQVDLDTPALAEIHSLPWELLYRLEVGSFLALDRRFAVVRHLRLPVSRPPVAPRRLKVLVAVAAPSDRQRLDSEEECRRIAASWQGDDAIAVRFLTHATLDKVRRLLLAEEVHGLHFIGHGHLDPESGEGLLLFEDEHGEVSPCSGRDLAIQLADRTSLRWVFLNACSTGSSSTHRPFGGLAAALLRTGVPAVLAMQRPVSDQSAVVFSQTVYERLAAGDGIDTAVSEGRLAIHRLFPRSTEWATPVLFLRAADGTLFRRAGPPPSLPVAADPIRDHGASGTWPRTRGWIVAIALLLLAFIGIKMMVSQFRSPDPLSELRDHRPADAASVPSKLEADAGRAVVTMREGEVVDLPGVRGWASVSFNDDYSGTPFARLTVSLEGDPQSIDKPLMGPTTVALKEGWSLRVQTVDLEQREISILAIGPD